MAALSDAAAVLFEHLPATYGTDRDDVDPVVARWLEALAFELGRAGALLEALRSTTIPTSADDTVGSLRRWEDAVGIPRAPDDVSIGQRRATLMGFLRARRVASGIDWTAAITAALGSSSWQAFENTPGPNQLTVQIPYAPGSYTAAQVEALVRRRTPANQQIVMRYEDGFIVGVSRPGDAI